MSHGTVYSHFRKWQGMDVFEAFFQGLPIDADLKNISIDSTFAISIKASAVGISRSSKNTKNMNYILSISPFVNIGMYRFYMIP